MKADIASILKKTAKAIETGDGAWFELESQIDFKTQGEYGGVRQAYRSGIGDVPKDIKRAQIINFNLSIGDPVTPGPVGAKTNELPTHTLPEHLRKLVSRHSPHTSQIISGIYKFVNDTTHSLLSSLCISRHIKISGKKNPTRSLFCEVAGFTPAPPPENQKRFEYDGSSLIRGARLPSCQT